MLACAMALWGALGLSPAAGREPSVQLAAHTFMHRADALLLRPRRLSAHTPPAVHVPVQPPARGPQTTGRLKARLRLAMGVRGTAADSRTPGPRADMGLRLALGRRHRLAGQDVEVEMPTLAVRLTRPYFAAAEHWRTRIDYVEFLRLSLPPRVGQGPHWVAEGALFWGGQEGPVGPSQRQAAAQARAGLGLAAAVWRGGMFWWMAHSQAGVVTPAQQHLRVWLGSSVGLAQQVAQGVQLQLEGQLAAWRRSTSKERRAPVAAARAEVRLRMPRNWLLRGQLGAAGAQRRAVVIAQLDY